MFNKKIYGPNQTKIIYRMSKPYTLEGFTTRPGEKQLATMRELEAAEASRHPLRFLPLLGGLLLASLLLVLGTITTVAIVRRKMRGATNSPSQQLELLTGSGGLKGEAMDSLDSVDYSPDIIPKDGGTLMVIPVSNNQFFHIYFEKFMFIVKLCTKILGRN